MNAEVHGITASGSQVSFAADFNSIALRGFLCPKCGGRYFGSYDPHDGGEWIRHCHDQKQVRCDWSGRVSEALDPSEDLSVHPMLRR